SQNAADLLSAPERLAEFMDNSVLRWFQKRTGPLSLFKQGTKVAMKLLERIFGAEFLTSLSEVFNHLEGMQAGFHQRNREVVELLQSKDTAFFLVSYPSEVRYEESRSFVETLRERRLSLAAIL